MISLAKIYIISFPIFAIIAMIIGNVFVTYSVFVGMVVSTIFLLFRICVKCRRVYLGMDFFSGKFPDENIESVCGKCRLDG